VWAHLTSGRVKCRRNNGRMNNGDGETNGIAIAVFALPVYTPTHFTFFFDFSLQKGYRRSSRSIGQLAFFLYNIGNIPSKTKKKNHIFKRIHSILYITCPWRDGKGVTYDTQKKNIISKKRYHKLSKVDTSEYMWYFSFQRSYKMENVNSKVMTVEWGI